MITIKQVKRLTMTLSWGSLVKPQQMEEHLPRTETSDPASRCSTLTTLSGPFFANKPKVAFLSWHDRPSLLILWTQLCSWRKGKLVSTDSSSECNFSGKVQAFASQPNKWRRGNVAIATNELRGREWNACCSFHWPFIQSTNPERAVAGPAFVCSQLLLENTFRKLHLFF